MRILPVLLAGSLLANIALGGLWLFRRAVVQPGVRARPASASRAGEAAAADGRRSEALLAALRSGDSAAMTAAGVPAEIVRHLAAARAFARLAALARTQGGPPPGGEYWRNTRTLQPPPTREQRGEQRAAEREFETAMREAFGTGWNEDWRGGRYGFLPAERQEQLRRIERDYDDMRRDLSADTGDVQLAADRERLKLLGVEMERDINAALSPAEREQVELRSSNAARFIIDQYGDILTSEDEYKRLYALRKDFDDRYSSEEYHARARTPEDNRLRLEAERKLNDELRALIGEERWAAVPAGPDREFQVLGTLTNRLALPAGTPEQVYAVRESYAAQSLAVQNNPALSAADRRRQLGELATRAKDELRAKLGTDGVNAYLGQAGWVHALQDGAAFVTNARLLPPGSPRPAGGTTSYRLPPPTPAPKR